MDTSDSSDTAESTQANYVDDHQEAATGNPDLTSCGMDLAVYKAASEGNINSLWRKKDHLHQILTPTKSTVLHIYIACATLTKPQEVLKSANIVEKILEMCPSLLLQHNQRGETALHIAARHGRAAIVEVLIKAAKAGPGDLEINGMQQVWRMLIRTTNNENDTALHEAVRFNHLSVVKILTREDPEFLYSANDGDETPLYLAVERGYRDLVLEILGTCRYPAYEGPDGRTALHAAVIFNDTEITAKLIEAKRALTKEVDEEGWTPLHLAAFLGHISIVKQLLDSDRSIAYIRDKDDKKTALHIASYKGHADVMKELVSRCPDSCELVDHKGRNVLHYAFEKRQFRIWTCVRKDPWLCNILLNGNDIDGKTPLHQLVASDFYDSKYGLSFEVRLHMAGHFIRDARVDKMAFNKENLNAVDIIQATDTSTLLERLLKWLLKKWGARPGHRILRSKDINGDSGENNKIIRGGDDRTEVLIKEVKEAHLVVAALIATVTFAAGFTMPGGYQSEKGPDQGSAVLTKNAAFKAFVITDTLAMIFSSCSVIMHLGSSIWPNQKGMMMTFKAMLGSTILALFAMVIAFITGTYAVLGQSSGFAIAVCVLACYLFATITASNVRLI